MAYTHYAVYQVGYPIFGIGDTPDAAIKDAEKWLPDQPRPLKVSQHHETVGELCLARCSTALADKVGMDGGDFAYEETTGPRHAGGVAYLHMPNEQD